MSSNPLEDKQIIFANIFIFYNRLQTACEKIQREITMKQWLMLAIASSIDGNKNLTKIGNLMGCSRQNIKKLANPLENKGFIVFEKRENNSLNIIITKKYYDYSKNMSSSHLRTLNLLFEKFNDEEIKEFMRYLKKLEDGLINVETYGETINERN